MANQGQKLKLGLLPPQPYMKSELDKLFKEYDVHVLDVEENNWEESEIAKWTGVCREKGIPAVCGFAQKDAWHHALINAALGNVTIKPHAYLIAMNKYMQRTIEPNAFWFEPCDPETHTNEELIGKVPKNEWPFMLKNTSLSLGRGVFRIKTPQELVKILDMYKADEALRAEIKKTNNAIIDRMDEETKASLGPVPPFIMEHCIDLTLGWVEYCYEGCVNEEGAITHYGMTEEMYFGDHQSLAYVTPPVSYGQEYIPQLETYIIAYMKGLVNRGYLKQFFNIEFWASFTSEDNEPMFAFCEINPRCAHTFHFGYKFAYGTNLYKDNWDLVLLNQSPKNTPWQKWREGINKTSCEILITTVHEGLVSDQIDQEYVKRIEDAKEVDLVRYIKPFDHVITPSEAASGAGCTMLQIWITTDTPEQAARREMEIRRCIYKTERDWDYPSIWLDLAK